MRVAQRIVPCLWFDHQAEEAAKFYVSVFKNSKITTVSRYSAAGQEIHGRPPGSVMVVAFELDGQTFTALNGGPDFKFNEAISLQVYCETQQEIDYYWEKLSKGGDPKAQQCGWLKDKYGLSWQVVPDLAGRAAGGSRIAEGAAGDDGDAADEEDRHRRARARGGRGAFARVGVKQCSVPQCEALPFALRACRYSCRNATSGSTRLARRAGK